jgi:hypothetical protein
MARLFLCLLVMLTLAAAGSAGALTCAAVADHSGLGIEHQAPRLPASAPVPSKGSGWHSIEKDGVFWLTTPTGQLFYSTGVNFLDSGKESQRSKEKQAYYWGNFYPTLEAWRRAVGSQLLDWGFNTRGGWSDPSPEFNLALTVDLELGRNSKFHWFDPFSPEQESLTHEWADRLTAPFRNDHKLLGYFSDNEVGWWNSPLFVWYLNKSWENHTKRALWQLLYDHYQGRWDELLKDWVPGGTLAGFEELKDPGAKMQLRPGGYGIRVVDRFMHLYCRHYYRLMAEALRRAHPGALILGDRLPLYYHQDAVLAMGDDVDVISTNYNVDVPDGWVAPYYFDGLRRLSKKPVLVTEFFFAAEENRSGNTNETARSKYPKPGHLMTVNTQAERASGVMNAIRNFARFPNVVGTHWFQYCDEPFGGREDGENYNMGLIDLANRPYEEITEVFRRWNPKLEEVHRESAGPLNAGVLSSSPLTVEAGRGGNASLDLTLPQSPPSREGSLLVLSSSTSPRDPAPSTQHSALSTQDPVPGTQTPYPVTRANAPINLTDQSLMDWDKGKTRLLDFQTPPPYVPFGDVHLAWAPEGLYLASLANTYVDPEFLAYQGEFPLSETFQIHVLATTSGEPEHYAIHLVPQPNPLFPDGFEMKPRLYRYLNGQAAAQLSVEGRVQHIEKSLPHVAVEAFFPAEWFGVGKLHAGQKLRMNIQMVSFYREFIMSWTGVPQLRPTRMPEALREVVLLENST